MRRVQKFKLRTPTQTAAVLLALLFVVVSCMPEVEEEDIHLPYDLRLELFRNIYDFGDRGMTDSLVSYLDHEEPKARYAALLSLASIQDSSESVLAAMAEKLNDSHTKVASMAAYAMGQTLSSSATPHLINSFRAHDTTGEYALLNGRILEAVGKCGNEDDLRMLATIATYRPSDTLLLEGQTRGLYRFSLRNMTSSEGTDVMVNYATRKQFPSSVRLIAANYLARAPGIDLTEYAYTLARTVGNESREHIRMALALAVSKVGSARARDVLTELAENDPDYRVRANALRSLDAMGGPGLTDLGLRAIRDPHPHVSQLAGRLLIRHVSEDMATGIHELATDEDLPIRTRALLYAAALKNMPFYFTVTAGSINADLRQFYESERNPFTKAVWSEALSYDPINLPHLIRWFETEEDPFLRVSILRHLENTLKVALDKPPVNFNRGLVVSRIADTYRAALETGEPGPVNVASELILQNIEILRPRFQNQELFVELLESAENTGMKNALVRAHNALFESKIELVEPEWNNPINWELFDRLPDTVHILMELTSGDIRLALPKNEHPGTVTNFTELVLEGFYNGKHIHRVVPNFVIQGGCPVGDGYGSLDHTIRSELPPVYYDDEGFLGMASAGNHTESVQWFITHSPTMHLDGNYSRFGKVYEGMDTVHSADIGTVIRRIELLNE